MLVVEDDTFIRKILRHSLEKDFTVTTLGNGIEAMTWLEEGHTADIMITDLQMPFLNGQELIQTIRSSSLFGHLPIIVVSNHDDSTMRITCLEIGADDYIVKPFNPLEVRAKIMAVMRRSEQRNSGASSLTTAVDDPVI